MITKTSFSNDTDIDWHLSKILFLDQLKKTLKKLNFFPPTAQFHKILKGTKKYTTHAHEICHSSLEPKINHGSFHSSNLFN